MRLKTIQFLLPIILIFSISSLVSAQEQVPELPTYIVQPGDTLFSISIRFGVSLDELIQANNLTNPDILSPGTAIKIPGLTGISGTLTTETIQLGETLRSLSIQYQIPINIISKLNRLTGPMEAYAGASLVLPEEEIENRPQNGYVLEQNQSVLDLSAENRVNPWILSQVNQMQGTWDILPGDAIFKLPELSSNQDDVGLDSVSLVSPFLRSVRINPLPLVQGFTFVINIETLVPLELEGTLDGYSLRFFKPGTNSLVALQGIHAMAVPGITPFTLKGSLQDGRTFSFEQMVVLQAAGYSREDIIGVDPTTIDPEVTQPENELVAAITSQASSEKFWDGLFVSPGYDPNWITSWFGTRRSYNESPYSFFHTGVDYGGGTGLEIKSPASGVVVLAQPLVVRGNATIIDHGWGVYSGFWHQSEFKVKVGDKVEKGQVIGLVGGTGRVTGAHLHWEVWVNGVQVNPLTWLSQTYP